MLTFLNSFISTAYAANDFIGTIDVPAGVPSAISSTTGVISAVVRFLVVIAGLFSLFQFLTGGLAFITSAGDKGKITEAQNKIQMSIVGLMVIAASFLIIAIVSQVLFGDFTAILIPKLQSVSK